MVPLKCISLIRELVGNIDKSKKVSESVRYFGKVAVSHAGSVSIPVSMAQYQMVTERVRLWKDKILLRGRLNH